MLLKEEFVKTFVLVCSFVVVGDNGWYFGENEGSFVELHCRCKDDHYW